MSQTWNLDLNCTRRNTIVSRTVLMLFRYDTVLRKPRALCHLAHQRDLISLEVRGPTNAPLQVGQQHSTISTKFYDPHKMLTR